MIIRTARPDDAGDIVAFWNPMIRETDITFSSMEKTGADVSAMITTRIDAGYGFLVAQAGDAVLGFASYAPFRAADGYAFTAEHTIIVAPFAHGRGVGRTLLTELEKVAARAKIHSLIGVISTNNTAAISFHEAMGFQTVGQVPDAGRKFDQWLDLTLMQKFL